MSVIDVAALLTEISPESPAGENLEYEPLFLEMVQDAQCKREQVMGEESISAEDPNWQDVKKKALELAPRSMDLRIGVYLCHALTRVDGFPGMRCGLELLTGYVRQYWDQIHPLLDPDDGNDPTMRVNVLRMLGQTSAPVPERDADLFMRAVAVAPLVESRVAGVISYRDVQIARGEVAAPTDSDPPSESFIAGVFAECDLDELQVVAEACGRCRELAGDLEDAVNERVGVVEGTDLGELKKLLGALHQFVAEQLASRGVAVEGAEVEVTGSPAAESASISGEIRSRDDVTRMLDKISRYYTANEPSSPVPLLMERAKRLVHANFLDLVRDLAPDGVEQVENIRGRGQQGASDSDE